MTITILRNTFHPIIGFTILYFLGFVTNFFNFITEAKLIGVNLLCLIIGYGAGRIWEEYWHNKYPEAPISQLDIWLTVGGAFIGGNLAAYYGNSQTILFLSLIVSVLLLVFNKKIK